MKLLFIHIISSCFLLASCSSSLVGAAQNASDLLSEKEFQEMLAGFPPGLAQTTRNLDAMLTICYARSETPVRMRSTWEETPLEKRMLQKKVELVKPRLVRRIFFAASQLNEKQINRCIKNGNTLPKGSLNPKYEALISFKPAFYAIDREFTPKALAEAKARFTAAKQTRPTGSVTLELGKIIPLFPAKTSF